jgi:hypothetical protein
MKPVHRFYTCASYIRFAALFSTRYTFLPFFSKFLCTHFVGTISRLHESKDLFHGVMLNPTSYNLVISFGDIWMFVGKWLSKTD